MAHQGLQVLSQFRVGDDYPLSSTLCVLTSRPAHDLLGLASEVDEHGAGIVEVLEGVADVTSGLHILRARRKKPMTTPSLVLLLWAEK